VVAGLDSSNFGLLLGYTLGKERVVLALLFLLVLKLAALDGTEVTAALQTHGGNKTLDLGSLGIWLCTLLLLTDDLSPDHVLPHVVLFRQVEEFPDLRCPLRPQTFWQYCVSQSWDLLLPLLDNDDGQNSDIRTDDASSNTLTFTFAGSSWAEARVAVGEEKASTVREKNTLFHREPLLVVSAGYTENVASKFVTNRVSRDFLGHLLVEEDTVAFFVIEVDEFLSASGGVGNVNLHFLLML